MPVGVVSGLRRETDCLITENSSLSPNLLCFAGVGVERAEAGARQLLDQGARALISFGVAGGTAPQATAGAVLLADKVIDGDICFATDANWREKLGELLAGGGPVIEGPIAGVDKMISSAEAKRQIYTASGALACDMESHAVARVAGESGVPFMVVRAISDPDHREVPKWILRCLTPDGGIRYGRLLAALARRPWNLPTLMALGGDSKKAFAGLRRVARLAGPGLGFPGGL